jgi:transketolase
VGENGAVVGLDRFGASGPGQEVLDNLGFAVDDVKRAASDLLH